MKITNSQRLSYRLMTEHDTQLLFEVDQDPTVMKYINGGKVSSMDSIQTVMIPRLLKYLTPSKGWGIWQVNTTDDNQYIGWVLVRPMDFFSDSVQYNNLELGWRFKALAWGNGYASEAAKHIMDELSHQTDVKRFCAIADKENTGSIRVMEKLGMDYVKTYIHSDPLGQWDVVYYELKKP